jgi:hypothetical protein
MAERSPTFADLLSQQPKGLESEAFKRIEAQYALATASARMCRVNEMTNHLIALGSSMSALRDDLFEGFTKQSFSAEQYSAYSRLVEDFEHHTVPLMVQESLSTNCRCRVE